MIWTPASPQDLCPVHLHFGSIILGWVFSLGSSKQVVLHASNITIVDFQWLLYLHVLFGHHRTCLIWSDNTFACLWSNPLTLQNWLNFCLLFVGPQAQVWRPELGSGIRFEKPRTEALQYVQIQDSRQFVFTLRTLPALHRSRMCVQTMPK